VITAPPTAADILRAALKLRRVTHAELAEKMGVTESGIRKRLYQGAFSAEWFLAALRAIGEREIRLD